jgi:hypothetical protein
MTIKKFLVCASTAVMVTSCATPITEQYQAAVKDAAIVEAKEATNQLWAINKNNANLIWNKDKTKLLVVTWKSLSAYDKFLKNNSQTSDDLNYALWVTAAPQVKKFCQQLKQHEDDDRDLNLRLKQYLGLAPDWQYDVFVEMWVSPESLFRPCVDPDIDDSECKAKIPKDFFSSNRIDEIPDYGKFYQQLYFKSFRASAGVPWTGLGYTYDWGNEQSRIGASEFILKPESDYDIKQVSSTHDYCSK